MKRKIIVCSLVLGLSVCLSSNLFAAPIEAGFGKIKMNGLMQWWYQSDKGEATATDTFRLRRAEIKFSGEITPEVLWAVMIDPAQLREDLTRKSPLQDFLIILKPNKQLSVNFGQFKVPFGMEGLESSAKLDFIERSALTSQFKWADYRDVGVTLNGDFNSSNGIKIQSAVGIFNGEGQNKLDANDPMDFVGRLVIKPTENLHLGVAHYNGEKGTSTDNSHSRTGAEIKFIQNALTLYGEYVTGKSSGKSKKTYYLAAGYKLSETYQVVAKYDWYDPDTDNKDDDKSETTIGLNYFIEKHNAKVQLNYCLKGEKGRSINNDVIRCNVQISY